MVDPNTRQGKRTPVTLKIKFKSETIEQFIERYAVDVSQGGIFIRTKEPLAVGTQMRFEFQLRDASPLIAGEGTVVWTRENDPSRPAIAPGMGVRFDRLAEGSQGVLERILSEKAKQAPQRPPTDTSKPPMFTDTPTRVAPAPIQEALLGNESNASRLARKRPDSFGDSGTPLPRPMPFHSDAEDFDEQAFEEATKVRALDELIAQTADATTTDMPADELATRRAAATRSDSTVGDRPDSDRAATVDSTVRAPYADRDSAPGLPSPPEPSRPNPKILDTTPSPRTEASSPSQPPANTASTPYGSPNAEGAKTRLGLEPARVPLRAGPSSPPMNTSSTSASPSIRDAVTKPTGMRAAQAEPRAASAPLAPQKSSSIASIAILLLLLVAAGGAAVWFFVLREQADDEDVVATPKPGSNAVKTPDGSNGSAVTNTNGSNGSNGSATGAIGSNGSAAVVQNGGSNGSAVAPPAELVDTVITASVDKAAIEVVGTDQKGPSPLKAKLEKGKAYKARVQAPGYANLEVDVKGGEALPKSKATLVMKKRRISVTSEPPGAAIMVDNAGTGKTTPFEIELTPAQAARRMVRIGIRKTGYRSVEKVVDAKLWVEDTDAMTATLEVKLDKQQIVIRQPPPPNTGSGSAGSATPTNTGSGSDSGTGSGTGSDTNGGGTGTQTPTPTPTGSGSAVPSAGTTPKEPVPDFVTKP